MQARSLQVSSTVRVRCSLSVSTPVGRRNHVQPVRAAAAEALTVDAAPLYDSNPSSNLPAEHAVEQVEQVVEQVVKALEETVTVPQRKVSQVAVELAKLPYQWYHSNLEKHPYTTKAMTSFVGFMLGDMIAQYMSHHGHDAALDLMRILRLGAYGLLLDGPVGSLWYDLLERTVLPEDPTSNKAVALKTAADQVVWAPVMTVAFFAVVKALEGHPEQMWSTIHDKTVPTIMANYMVWPLAHVVNFKYVPHHFRILYNNTVSVAWLTWLSLLTHAAGTHALSS